MALTSVGQHFSRNLDQYTIMCVFGSVFGCVVLPLVAHSIESFIITAILLGVTVKTWTKKPVAMGTGSGRETLEERKKEKKGKKSPSKRHVVPPQTIMDGETLRRQREYDIERQEEMRLINKERRSEEKRDKKARKREVSLRRREEEKIEKEREKVVHEEKVREREERKKKTAKMDFPFPNVETVATLMGDHKPLRRERKYSTSSSASSVSISSSISNASVYSLPGHSPSPSSSKKTRPLPCPPVRASSAPLILTTPPVPLYREAVSRQVPPVHHIGCHTSPTGNHAPPRYQNKTPPTQMILLPHAPLPLVADQTPHPHLFYNSLPRFNSPCPTQPLLFHAPPGSVTMETSSYRSTVSLTSTWPDVDKLDHMTAVSEAREVDQSDHPPIHDIMGYTSSIKGVCGPAQDFYSFLGEQVALNRDIHYSPVSPVTNNNIWSPPSDDQPQEGEDLEVWPSFPMDSQ